MSIKIGDKFGRLKVIELLPNGKNPKAKCVCDCGKITTPQRGALKNGKATSCGCRRFEFLRTVAITHGMSDTQTYRVYSSMVSRCTNPNDSSYENYGGRGIKVMWDSFEEFFKDMGEKPNGSQIDRLDNNGNYEKSNCAWVSPAVNAQNKRTSKIWLINGVAYTSSTIASKALGINPSQIIRNCSGFLKNGKYYPPKNGWSCVTKYTGREFQ